MMRLEETESILEFENNESGKLFHSFLTISTATDFTVHTVLVTYISVTYILVKSNNQLFTPTNHAEKTLTVSLAYQKNLE